MTEFSNSANDRPQSAWSRLFTLKAGVYGLVYLAIFLTITAIFDFVDRGTQRDQNVRIVEALHDIVEIEGRLVVNQKDLVANQQKMVDLLETIQRTHEEFKILEEQRKAEKEGKR